MWLLLTACTSDPPVEAPPSSSPSPSTGTEVPTGDTGSSTAVDPLVVLSLNLHCLKLEGTPFGSTSERFAAVAAEVAARGVDAIAAQEVCVGPTEDARDLLAEALLEATGETWTWHWTFAHVAWEGTPDQADEGVAVFARQPLGAVSEVVYVSPGQLRRVAVVATLAEGPSLATVHLDYDDPVAREDQARQTAAFLLVSGLDAIVAGDFNDLPGSATHGAMGRMGYDDATAGLDADRIDHLFVHSGAGWTTLEAHEVLTDPPVSDHPGMVVAFVPRVAPVVEVTRFVASIDVGFGHAVSIRGDTEPLSWDQGWWAVPTAADRWELVVPTLTAPFVFKALRDDLDWELGDDRAGSPGQVLEFTPAF